MTVKQTRQQDLPRQRPFLGQIRRTLIAGFLLALAGCGGGSGGGAAGAGSGGGTLTSYNVQVAMTDVLHSGSTVARLTTVATVPVPLAACATTCSAVVLPGTLVTLTAVPAAGYNVLWGGACAASGSTTTCTLTNVSADAAATVRFDPVAAGVWWVAATGNDSNDGLTPATGFATFRKALTTMAGGDTLYVDDGTYNDTIGAFGGAYSSGEIPDGPSVGHPTKILGYRPHAVTVDGQFARIPLQIFHGNNIEVGNIVFLHSKNTAPLLSPVHVEQSSNIYLHQVGAAYPAPACDNCMGIASEASNHVTIEECWAWGFGGRYSMMAHGGNNNILRRNVTRYDGSVDGNPRAGLAVYAENNTIAENNITIDFDGTGDNTSDNHSAFFVTSSVPNLPLGTVSWYGNIAFNTTGILNGVFEIDSQASLPGTVTLVDNVIANYTSSQAAVAGIWASSDRLDPATPGGGHHSLVLRHNTVYKINGAAIRVDATPSWSSVTVSDNLVDQSGSAHPACFDDRHGGITGTNNLKFACTTNFNDLPLTNLLTVDPGLRFLLRTEAATPGHASASDGGDRGATVVNRYVSGTVTGTALWPFPNEDAIKQDFCLGPDNGTTIRTRGHNQTGWCASAATLTHYIWEALGNISPF